MIGNVAESTYCLRPLRLTTLSFLPSITRFLSGLRGARKKETRALSDRQNERRAQPTRRSRARRTCGKKVGMRSAPRSSAQDAPIDVPVLLIIQGACRESEVDDGSVADGQLEVIGAGHRHGRRVRLAVAGRGELAAELRHVRLNGQHLRVGEGPRVQGHEGDAPREEVSVIPRVEATARGRAGSSVAGANGHVSGNFMVRLQREASLQGPRGGTPEGEDEPHM